MSMTTIGETMKNKKGFTLIELLIVFCIIFILIAIALPPLMKNRENETETLEVITQEQEAQEMVVDEDIQPIQPEKKKSGGFKPL